MYRHPLRADAHRKLLWRQRGKKRLSLCRVNVSLYESVIASVDLNAVPLRLSAGVMDISQSKATVERALSDRSYATGNIYAFQSATESECKRLNPAHARGNTNTGQTDAIRKRATFNRPHAVRNSNVRQGPATGKRATSNIGNACGNDYAGQIRAVGKGELSYTGRAVLNDD